MTGPFLVHSSIARVNREVAAALLSGADADVGLKPRGFATQPPQSFPHGEAIRTAFYRQPRHLDLTIRHHWPHDFSRPPVGRLAVILPWEFGAVPRRWVEGIQQNVDELWVPSAFVRDVFRRCGVDRERIAVIPNGVDTEVFRPEGESWRPAQARGFVFLFVGGMIPRKGPDLVLEAYRWAFRKREDVTLVFKDIGSKSYYQRMTLLPRVRQLAQQKGARVLVLTEDLEDRKLAALYRGCDVLVAPYRGEGFCFPLAEAMACGKPVITTAEGPSQEFCTPKCAYLIPARTVPHPTGMRGFGELAGEFTWFEPDLEELAHWMRHVYEHREEAALRGARGVDRIRPAFEWTTVTEKYLERVAALTRAGRTPRSWQARALEPRKRIPIRKKTIGRGHRKGLRRGATRSQRGRGVRDKQFLFSEQMFDNFSSEYGEVEWIIDNLKPGKGVFVDVGASDGVEGSNTYYFERHLAWSGLCIEPDPRNYRKLLANRTCQKFYCAIGSNPAKRVRLNKDPTWSGMSICGEHLGDYVGDSDAPTLRLEDVLDKFNFPRPISLLSIDVEGDELEAWSTFDQQIWKPQIVIIEFLSRNSINNEVLIKAAFSKLPYKLVHKTTANLIFQRAET